MQIASNFVRSHRETLDSVKSSPKVVQSKSQERKNKQLLISCAAGCCFFLHLVLHLRLQSTSCLDNGINYCKLLEFKSSKLHSFQAEYSDTI